MENPFSELAAVRWDLKWVLSIMILSGFDPSEASHLLLLRSSGLYLRGLCAGEYKPSPPKLTLPTIR
jgi:hypothetical protein